VNVNIRDCMIWPRFTHTRVSCNTSKGVVSVISTRYTKKVGNNHIVGNDSSSLVVDGKDDCHPLSVKKVGFKAELLTFIPSIYFIAILVTRPTTVSRVWSKGHIEGYPCFGAPVHSQ